MGCGSRNNAVSGTNRIVVAIVAKGRYSETSWGCNDIGKVPAKGDGLRRSDFVVGGGSLGRLGDGKQTSRSGLGNYEAGRG